MGDNEVAIQLSLAIDQAQRNLAAMNTSVMSFTQSLTGFFGTSSASWSSFVGNLAADAAEEALKVTYEAAKELFDLFVVDGVAAAEKQQDAENQLVTAFEETGIATQANVSKFNAYADSIQATTRYSNDEVITNAALLQSLGHLSEDGLEKATHAATDLAAGLHEDLGTAFEQLSKAEEGNTTALSKHIGTIQKGNDAAETFANTLKAVESHFGGAAVQAVNTYSGALAQNKNEFEEVQKATGQFIVDNPVVIDLIHQATSEFKLWSTEINGNKSEILDFVDDGLVNLVKGMGYTLIGIDGVIRAGKGFTDFFTSLFPIAVDLGVAAVDKLGLSLVSVINIIPGMKAKTGEIANELNGQLTASLQQAGQQVTTFANDFSQQGALGKAGQGVLDLGNKLQQFAAKHKTLNAGIVIDETQTTQQMHDLWSDLLAFYGGSNQQRIQDLQATLKTISTLSSDSTGTLFVVGQAAAIATATIDGYAAVQKALASAPPPYNFALAALVGVATAANIAKIAETAPPAKGSFASGGIVGGNNTSGDTIPVNANSREMILTMNDQANLLNQIRSGSPQGASFQFIVQGDVNANNQAQVDQLVAKVQKKLLYANLKLRGATS